MVMSRCVPQRFSGKQILELAVLYRDPAVHNRKFEFPVLEANKVRKISFLDLAAQSKAELACRVLGDLPDGIRDRHKTVFGK